VTPESCQPTAALQRRGPRRCDLSGGEALPPRAPNHSECIAQPSRSNARKFNARSPFDSSKARSNSGASTSRRRFAQRTNSFSATATAIGHVPKNQSIVGKLQSPPVDAPSPARRSTKARDAASEEISRSPLRIDSWMISLFNDSRREQPHDASRTIDRHAAPKSRDRAQAFRSAVRSRHRRCFRETSIQRLRLSTDRHSSSSPIGRGLR